MDDFNEKLVSVIIPTYSRTKYIKRAIDSLLRQTYKNIEIIVVDDNDSKSEYRKELEIVMKSYLKYKNIKYIKHNKNSNGASARNTGIKESKGDYVCFLDDDDYYLESRIKKCVFLLENNPYYHGIYTKVVKTRKKRIVSVIDTKGNGNFLNEVLSQKGILGTGSNMFFTREAINNIGFFDTTFLRHQDLEYMVRFFEKYEIFECNEPLVVKCQDNRINELNINKSIEMREHFLNKFEYLIKVSPKKSLIFFNNYFSLAINCLYYREYKKYRNMIKIAKENKNLSLKDRIKIIFGYINGYIKIINIVEYVNNRYNIKKISKKIKNQISEYEYNYE